MPVRFLNLGSDAAILDVGCGSGAWLSRLHGCGYTNLTGFDGDVAQMRFTGGRIAQVDLNHMTGAQSQVPTL
jgi:cyclopropane fatty-acyl-phospholipid synthase-like methyltransferase